VVSSAPCAVITGAAFDARTLADAALLAAGFGSAVVDVTLADAEMKAPSGWLQSLCATVSANCADAPPAREAMVHLTCPVPPVPGVVHAQPVGIASPWKMVCDGIEMVIATFAGFAFALAHPPLPEWLATAIRLTGDALVPMMLISLGVRLAEVPLRDWRVGVVGGLVCPLTGIVMARGTYEDLDLFHAAISTLGGEIVGPFGINESSSGLGAAPGARR